MVNLSSPRDIVKHAIRNDPSFKAILYPHQCFIGNLSIHLAKNVPVEVSVLKNKLYTKFAIIPQSGVGQKDTIVGFSQFKSISLKSEGSESEATRPAIIFRLTTKAAQVFMRAVGENVAYTLKERAMNSSSEEYLQSTIILILQDNPKFESEEVFMQCIVKGFGGQENQRVLNFDQKTGYDIWQNDIKMKWRVTMSEKWKKNFGNREHELVDTMAAKEFAQLMNTLQLNLKIIDNDRKYLWLPQKKIHISSLFKEKKDSQLATETLIERVGTKRKAEAPPVKPALTALKSLKLVSGQRIVTKEIVRKVTNEAVHLSDDEKETSVVVAKPKGEEPEKKHLEVNEETPILTSSHSNFGSVVIIVKDMHTLARQEFVNDNIINFTIDYMYDCRIIKSLRDKIHVFVTFFYSRLSGGINSALLSNTSGLTQDDKDKLDKNINLVSRWTLKKFDLFTKEYVVIPINEEFHWLVAIVVNPSGAIVEKNNEEESRKKPKCYIVFLDPLTGLDPRRQTNMTTLIKYYLNGLFNKSKTPGTKFATPTETFWDESRIEVFRPKNQPVQANYYDCGLFVLYYIEAFFCGIKPITVHDMPGFDWLDHFEKGEDIADLMRDKVYNTITRQLTSDNRSRLEQHENKRKHGLSTEGARRHRRHSAPWPRALPRDSEYHVRHYSLSPQRNNMQDQRIFNNPRELSKMIITQRVRSLRLPEEKFASMY